MTGSPQNALLSFFAIVIGAISTLGAFVLLAAICFFTNLFFFQTSELDRLFLVQSIANGQDWLPALYVVPAISLALIVSVVSAKAPVDNVSKKSHPNLAAAQRLSTQSYEKIVAAQKANEFDLGGHAQKAKDLLDQVNRELKAAAEASNADHK